MRAERLASAEGGSLSKVVWLGLWALALLGGVCGCATRRYLPSNQLPYETLAAPYRLTQLKTSTTLDVLGIIDAPEYQIKSKAAGVRLLNQSNTAIAVSGQSSDTFKTWVDLIVFDESRLTARRKYFFCSDERATSQPDRPTRVLIPPRSGIVFDAQCVLPADLQTTPYATEEARLMAIVRWLSEQYGADAKNLTDDPTQPVQANEYVSLSAMMVNQDFQGLLIELTATPGLTRGLADDQGVEFPHISLGAGRIRLAVSDDIVTVKIHVNLPM